LLPIIQAYGEGKTIEFLTGRGWGPIYEPPTFTESPDRYRIAPEKPAPPLWSRPEHVPLGAWIRHRSKLAVWLIAGATHTQVFAADAVWFYEGLGDLEHSTDQGRTWKPCTVAEGPV
jgi:hypothetical protein